MATKSWGVWINARRRGPLAIVAAGVLLATLLMALAPTSAQTAERTCAADRGQLEPGSVGSVFVIGDSRLDGSVEERIMVDGLSARGLRIVDPSFDTTISGMSIQEFNNDSVFGRGISYPDVKADAEAQIAAADVVYVAMGVNDWALWRLQGDAALHREMDDLLAFIDDVNPAATVVWQEEHADQDGLELAYAPNVASGIKGATLSVARRQRELDAAGRICLIPWADIAEAGDPSPYQLANPVDGVHLNGQEQEFIAPFFDILDELEGPSGPVEPPETTTTTTTTTTTGEVTTTTTAPPVAPLSADDAVRAEALAEIITGIERFGLANGDYGLTGGYLDRGTGYLHHHGSTYYAASIADGLVAAGHLDGPAPADPELARPGSWSNADFLVYRCRDRIAVFSLADDLGPSAADVAWWTSSGCITAPIESYGHPYFVVADPVAAIDLDSANNRVPGGPSVPPTPTTTTTVAPATTTTTFGPAIGSDDARRVEALAEVMSGIERFGLANNTYVLPGGFDGNGTGYFHLRNTGRYGRSIVDGLIDGGHLAAPVAADPTHPNPGNWSSSDFLVYRCRDRIAVFSLSDEVEPTAADAGWWTANGCRRAPIDSYNHPYYVLSDPLGAIDPDSGNNRGGSTTTTATTAPTTTTTEAGAGAAPESGTGYFHIRSVVEPAHLDGADPGLVTTSVNVGAATRWEIMDNNSDHVLIRHARTGRYLNETEDNRLDTVVSPRPSSEWSVVAYGENYLIRNNQSERYIDIDRPDNAVDTAVGNGPDRQWQFVAAVD